MIDMLGVGRFPVLTKHLPPHSLLNLYYLSAFLFGALLARNMDVVTAGYRRLNGISKCVLLVVVILAFYRGGGRAAMVNLPACCGVIIFSGCSLAQKWLSTSIPAYLGKISYSLYLTHIPLLFTFTILLYGRIPFPVIILLILSSCLGVSHLFCKYVEEPGIRLGKWLTKAKTTTAQPVASI
jgi:peptidoglycan/LPS O-acetylase OafA/YrhL